MCSIYESNHLRQQSLNKTWKFLISRAVSWPFAGNFMNCSASSNIDSQNSHTIFATDVRPIPKTLYVLTCTSYLWLVHKVLLQLFSPVVLPFWKMYFAFLYYLSSPDFTKILIKTTSPESFEPILSVSNHPKSTCCWYKSPK